MDSPPDSNSTVPTDLDQVVAEIARIDIAVEQHRGLNERTERELFTGLCEGESRKTSIISIALRDELIDELLTRRSILLALMVQRT